MFLRIDAGDDATLHHSMCSCAVRCYMLVRWESHTILYKYLKLLEMLLVERAPNKTNTVRRHGEVRCCVGWDSYKKISKSIRT